MKMCAAWAFHTLPDQFPQVMAFKSQLCLAQAQECILEKSLLDQGVRAGGGVLQAGPQAAGDESVKEAKAMR